MPLDMLHVTIGVAMLDKVRNEYIGGSIGI